MQTAETVAESSGPSRLDSLHGKCDIADCRQSLCDRDSIKRSILTIVVAPAAHSQGSAWTVIR